jgi:ribonuclease D
MLCDTPSGLATLAKQVLGVNMEKNWRVSCSNWAAEMLSQQQVKIFMKKISSF